MILKQYVVTLPADYDMGVIRSRVSTKGTGFDAFPGLGVKVFLIREKGRFGAESNQYAPLYLWPSVEAIWEFVAGDGFRGILDSFGWTPIHNWWGLAFERAPAVQSLANLQSVVKRARTVEPGTNLTELRNREMAAARENVGTSRGPQMRAVGLNPETWSLVQFDYWNCPQSDLPPGSLSYEILHTSAPGIDDLN